MVADVVLAVAMVAAAAGAIPEFQVGMGDVRSSAYGALMGVGCLDGGDAGFIGACAGEGDSLGPLGCGGVLFLLAEKPPGIGPPGHGDYIDDIFAEEQEIVGNGHEGEQAVREESRGGEQGKLSEGEDQVKQGEDPCLHGDDEEQQEMGIGVQRCVCQEQAQVQGAHIGIAAEDHAEYIHHQNAGKIEQVEAESAPDVFHGPSQGIITEQADEGIENIAAVIGKGIGDQPPYLTLENQSPVKIEQVVENVIACHIAHDVHQTRAQGNVEHQVGNTPIAVAEAETVESLAKIFQGGSTPVRNCVYFNSKW